MTPKRPQTPIFYYNLYNSKEMKKSIIAKTYESGPERANTRNTHTKYIVGTVLMRLWADEYES